MESTRQDVTVAARLGYEWNPDFATPQTKSRGGQNVPFWAKDNVDAVPDAADILSRFLGEILDDAGSVPYQAVPIREFCLPACLSILAAGIDTRVQRPMALLDERNDDGLRQDAKGTRRRSFHDGALSASDLYKALRKEVCLSMYFPPRKVLKINFKSCRDITWSLTPPETQVQVQAQ